MKSNTKKLFPKSLLLSLALTLAVAAAVSCKSPPTEKATLEEIDPKGQVIVFWHPYTQAQEQVLLTLVDEFNDSNEWDITAIGEYAGPPDAIHKKIQARVESGALPEIIVAERCHAAAYAAQDALVALSSYVESERWGYTEDELKDFLPFSMSDEDLPQFEERYSWPTYKSIEVLYYNEDLLAELGHTEPPKTWDEFKEMACAASDPEAETHGYELSIDSSTFIDMLSNRGGKMIDEEAAAYAFGEQEGLETLIFLQELLIEDCATPQVEQPGAQTSFDAGQALFSIGRSSDLLQQHSGVSAESSFNWSVSPLPTSLDAPKIQLQGPGLSIFKTTPEEQLAAWLFLKWFTEPEQQARWALANNTFPVRASAADLLQETFAENPQYEKAFGFLDYDTVTAPGVTGYDKCRAEIDQMLRAVCDLEHPETWLTSTANACDSFLEEAAVR